MRPSPDDDADADAPASNAANASSQERWPPGDVACARSPSSVSERRAERRPTIRSSIAERS